jgi:hypothetical protein
MPIRPAGTIWRWPATSADSALRLPRRSRRRRAGPLAGSTSRSTTPGSAIAAGRRFRPVFYARHGDSAIPSWPNWAASEVIVDQLIHMEDRWLGRGSGSQPQWPLSTSAREFARVLAADGNPGTIINISFDLAPSREKARPHYVRQQGGGDRPDPATRPRARAAQASGSTQLAPGPTNTPIMHGHPGRMDHLDGSLNPAGPDGRPSPRSPPP